jgi:MFS family permease
MIDPRARIAIIAGCAIAFVSFGAATSFGVFLKPVAEDLGWGREVVALSMAVQLLVWGIAQPVAGMLADRHGSAPVLALGTVVATIGFGLRALLHDPVLFVAAGAVVGLGIGACSFPVVLVALGRIVAPDRRSLVMGLGTASASAGMFVASPLALVLIDAFGWSGAMLLLGAAFLLILPLLLPLAGATRPDAAGVAAGTGAALRSALADRSYVLLFMGFFVCGFHVAFIQTHLPAFCADFGLENLGGWALATIGLFNIAGSLGAGWAGQHYSKRKLLAGIYAARAVVIAGFILVPLTPASLMIFAAAMGLLWLSTVPLTTGLVAQTQGLTHLSMLVGVVFLSHQVGSFTGAWAGGRIHDIWLDYTPMWWAAVVFGIIAALLHLPIREARVQQPA